MCAYKLAVGSGACMGPERNGTRSFSKLVADETHSSSELGGGSGFRAQFLKSPRPSAPEP
jgi:hypothetical protein